MTNSLNAAVAERVMGLERCISPLQPKGDAVPRHWRPVNGNISEWRVMKLPDYSTDIAAAFRVVEAMREKGYTFTLDDDPYNNPFGWRAGFFDSGKNDQPPISEATIPLAICNAALAALSTPSHGADGKE